MARTKPKPANSDPPAEPAPFDWLTHYPDATRFLARWTNAVAILNVLSDEFQDLASESRPISNAFAMRPDHERFKAVARAVLKASEEATAIPFRGLLDAVPTGFRPSQKGGAE